MYETYLTVNMCYAVDTRLQSVYPLIQFIHSVGKIIEFLTNNKCITYDSCELTSE